MGYACPECDMGLDRKGEKVVMSLSFFVQDYLMYFFLLSSGFGPPSGDTALYFVSEGTFCSSYRKIFCILMEKEEKGKMFSDQPKLI